MDNRKFISSSIKEKLRNIRKLKGIKSADALSKLMDCEYSPSGIRRREEGVLKIDFDYLDKFCAAVKLNPEEKENLFTSARLHLFHTDRSLLAITREYYQLRQRALAVCYYEYNGIPSELQIYDYTLAVVTTYEDYGDAEARAQLRYKISQELLADVRKETFIILHENAMYAPLGSRDVMWAQMQHLKKISQKENFRFKILPNTVFLKKPVVLSYLVLDDYFVVCEARNGMIITEDKNTTQDLKADFEILWQAAVDGEERDRLIDRAIEYYKNLPPAPPPGPSKSNCLGPRKLSQLK